MKTKELIKLLQEQDPSGELECCVGNVDIFGVYIEPAYWDGALQVLVRDESKKPYYNVVGAKYITEGNKITISTHSIMDALSENDNLPVEYVGINEKTNHYKESVEQNRIKFREIHNDCELYLFKEYLRKKFPELPEELIEKSATSYYNDNMSYKDPMPEDIKKMSTKENGMTVIPSWFERRCLQWDRELEINLNKNELLICKKIN